MGKLVFSRKKNLSLLAIMPISHHAPPSQPLRIISLLTYALLLQLLSHFCLFEILSVLDECTFVKPGIYIYLNIAIKPNRLDTKTQDIEILYTIGTRWFWAKLKYVT